MDGHISLEQSVRNVAYMYSDELHYHSNQHLIVLYTSRPYEG